MISSDPWQCENQMIWKLKVHEDINFDYDHDDDTNDGDDISGMKMKWMPRNTSLMIII